MVRQGIYAVATTVLLALIGLPLGRLWQAVSPHVTYVVDKPVLFPMDAETVGPIGTDARFALIGVVAGVVCGALAYLLAARGQGLGLVVGLALGGAAGSVLAWLPHHLDVQHLIHHTANGKTVTLHPDVGATGVLLAWPLAAVVVFALLEGLDIGRRASRGLPPGDVGSAGAGEFDQVGRGQL